MANPTTLPINPSVIALDSVVSRIEANEQQRRHDDAIQVRLFAEALDQVSADHFLTFRAGRLIPGNDRAEIAYRSIRAEIACALGISEQTVERRILGARDLHCRFPGCRAPLHRCDIDHTIDAQYGGPTSTSNLAHLCRGHHTLKHHGGWKVTQADGGVLHWESPAGRTYTDRPPSKVRFMTPTEATTHHQLSADSPPELPPF